MVAIKGIAVEAMRFDTQCPLCRTEAKTNDPKPLGIEFAMERIECVFCKTYEIADEARVDIAVNATEQRALSALTHEVWERGKIAEIRCDPASRMAMVVESPRSGIFDANFLPSRITQGRGASHLYADKSRLGQTPSSDELLTAIESLLPAN